MYYIYNINQGHLTIFTLGLTVAVGLGRGAGFWGRAGWMLFIEIFSRTYPKEK